MDLNMQEVFEMLGTKELILFKLGKANEALLKENKDLKDELNRHRPRLVELEERATNGRL